MSMKRLSFNLFLKAVYRLSFCSVILLKCKVKDFRFIWVLVFSSSLLVEYSSSTRGLHSPCNQFRFFAIRYFMVNKLKTCIIWKVSKVYSRLVLTSWTKTLYQPLSWTDSKRLQTWKDNDEFLCEHEYAQWSPVAELALRRPRPTNW